MPVLRKLANDQESPLRVAILTKKNCKWRKCAKVLAKIEMRGQRGPMRVAIMAKMANDIANN